MEQACVILSGGAFTPLPREWKDAFLIACDKGYEYALRQDLTPDIILGDFDSYCGKLPDTSAASACSKEQKVYRLPCEKDDTDTMYAVRMALDLGYRDLLISCGLGGRMDHLFANLQVCAFAASKGACCRIADESNEILVLEKGSVTLPAREGWSLSVYSLGDTCQGVTLKGTKYPLEQGTLTNTFPIGTSNEWTDAQAQISVEKGQLLIIQSRI